MTQQVFRKLDDQELHEEFLGNYLNILPVTYTNGDGDVQTDVMVYFISDDGSVGTENRKNVLIKDTELQFVPEDIVINEDKIADAVDSVVDFEDFEDFHGI